MTHDELLARVDKRSYHPITGKVLTGQVYYKELEALRAVVELHPMWTDYRYTETNKELVEFCGCCQEKWPCKTIQAVEKELN